MPKVIVYVSAAQWKQLGENDAERALEARRVLRTALDVEANASAEPQPAPREPLPVREPFPRAPSDKVFRGPDPKPGQRSK